MNRPAIRVIAAVLLLLVLAAPVLASSEEEGGGKEDLFNARIGWIFRYLQFALVFGGGAYLIAKKAPAFFRKRQETIVAAITESARLKEEAARRLREAEEKLARLDGELAELRAQAQREWAAEADRIRNAARDEAAKVERAGQAEIQAAERAARMELKAAAAQMAVERAEALILQQMTPQAQSALLNGFVQKLGGSAN